MGLKWSEFLSGFSTVKLLLPLSIPYLWKGVTMHSPHWRGGALWSSCLSGSFYIQYLEFCTGDLYILPHLFLYSIIYLVQTHRHWFCTLGYNLILHYLFTAQIVPGSASENSFNWLLCPTDITTSLLGVLLFSVLPYFLVLEDSIGLSCIFPAPVLEPTISLQGTWFLLLENIITNAKLWVLGMIFAAGVSWLLGPMSWQNNNRSVSTNPCIYTYLNIFLYASICIYIT